MIRQNRNNTKPLTAEEDHTSRHVTSNLLLETLGLGIHEDVSLICNTHLDIVSDEAHPTNRTMQPP